MDAALICERFERWPGSLAGQLLWGGTIEDITIHKVSEYGIVFSALYVPHVNSPVTLLLDEYRAEAIISSRNAKRGAMLFVRPASKQ
ncbi:MULTISPECIES: hypothetical protein [Sphingobium]|jgi:hypothetical protein|uniref:hypothetical protein n=1 Tax=Sphingobium TaxID=165695 RepID=UPI001BECA84B|nr:MULTISPECIES: hypothetical protein [Sphingobium]MBT2245085.1 hypothetical protein [Sphingobium sp. BHU LFT2]WBQ18925.1 hypothetical protein PAE53_24000 [Sphingobium yanoikuyae]